MKVSDGREPRIIFMIIVVLIVVAAAYWTIVYTGLGLMDR